MYYEFDEARRIHQPYTDGMERGKLHHNSTINDQLRLKQILMISFFSELLETATIQLAILKLEKRNVCYNYWAFRS